MFVEGGYRPDGEQFAERSASDQAFTVSNPLDLVGNIRALVAQAAAEQGKDFKGASWLRENISLMYHGSTRSEKDRQAFFFALRAAWDLVAYKELDGEYNNTVYNDISGYIRVFKSRTLTLDPLGVSLLDAMAQALDIADYTPGQDSFDISPFSIQATMERIEKGALYSSPLSLHFLVEAPQAANSSYNESGWMPDWNWA
jgi:hypothetical protein